MYFNTPVEVYYTDLSWKWTYGVCSSDKRTTPDITKTEYIDQTKKLTCFMPS